MKVFTGNEYRLAAFLIGIAYEGDETALRLVGLLFDTLRCRSWTVLVDNSQYCYLALGRTRTFDLGLICRPAVTASYLDSNMLRYIPLLLPGMLYVAVSSLQEPGLYRSRNDY